MLRALSSAILVHYVPSPHPGRAYRLILQGLRAHPRVALVDHADDARLIVWHDQAWDTRLRFDADRLVFVDFHDDPYRVFPVDCRAYFKRSWPCPRTGGPAFAMDAP